MKLVMTLLVRDEVDIVDANISYHLSQGVDFVIATDHSSRDGTTDVLRGYERDGVLLLREVEGEAHDQARHVNFMARAAAIDHGADWVINNDADEFWWPTVGSLKDVLSAVPDEIDALAAPRYNFVPRVGRSGSVLERMVVRETASTNGVGGPLEPKVVHRATPEIEMAPGNHSVEAPDLTVAPAIGLLEVLHFPMRTFEQFERKVLAVGIGYERLEARGQDVGRDQLALLELHRQGRLREHYESSAVDDASLDAAVATGRLVVDTRLRDHQTALGSAGPRPQAPDDARARKLVTVALELAAELARRSEELEAARADRARAERQLESTEAILRAVRASRLMRHSRRLRGLWYRLRGQTRGP